MRGRVLQLGAVGAVKDKGGRKYVTANKPDDGFGDDHTSTRRYSWLLLLSKRAARTSDTDIDEALLTLIVRLPCVDFEIVR